MVITATAPAHQTATCWVAISDKGPFAYDSNAPNGSISGFFIDCDGDLTLLNSYGITANTGTGSMPFDLVVSLNGAFFYRLDFGTGSTVGFAVGADGSLTAVPNNTSGIPSGANRLVAE